MDHTSFIFFFSERPSSPCSKVSDTLMECSVLIGNKVVFYAAEVNMCTLPATVTLQVSQPDIGYKFNKMIYSDIHSTVQIGKRIRLFKFYTVFKCKWRMKVETMLEFLWQVWTILQPELANFLKYECDLLKIKCR